VAKFRGSRPDKTPLPLTARPVTDLPGPGRCSAWWGGARRSGRRDAESGRTDQQVVHASYRVWGEVPLSRKGTVSYRIEQMNKLKRHRPV